MRFLFRRHGRHVVVHKVSIYFQKGGYALKNDKKIETSLSSMKISK